MNKRDIGDQGEKRAVEFLNKQGLIILDTQFHTRHGEIDIIAKDNEYIVFIEVKYRSGIPLYNPLEAVTKSKIRNIVNASRVYLYLKGYKDTQAVRYDCIGIFNEEITWIKNAFDAY